LFLFLGFDGTDASVDTARLFRGCDDLRSLLLLHGLSDDALCPTAASVRLREKLKESVSSLVVEAQLNCAAKLGRSGQVLASEHILIEIDNVGR